VAPTPVPEDASVLSDPGAGPVDLRVGGATDVGRVRELNEDAFLVQPPVFVVADGMGGHEAGGLASEAVVRNFATLAGRKNIGAEDVEWCIESSRHDIALLATGAGRPPGSTVVAVTVVQQGGHHYWLLANVGDSRAYLFVDGVLEQLSRDHSVVQELIDAGELTVEEAATHGDRNVITRALGALDHSPADYSLVPLTGGSRLVLCSDGVSGELPHADLATILAQGLEAQETAEELVRRAVDAGGHDNATAVVIDVVTDVVIDVGATGRPGPPEDTRPAKSEP
jgi:serine/threonine protein phosphatase PrpC